MKKVVRLILLLCVACAGAGCQSPHVYKDKESHTAGIQQPILQF